MTTVEWKGQMDTSGFENETKLFPFPELSSIDLFSSLLGSSFSLAGLSDPPASLQLSREPCVVTPGKKTFGPVGS